MTSPDMPPSAETRAGRDYSLGVFLIALVTTLGGGIAWGVGGVLFSFGIGLLLSEIAFQCKKRNEK